MTVRDAETLVPFLVAILALLSYIAGGLRALRRRVDKFMDEHATLIDAAHRHDGPKVVPAFRKQPKPRHSTGRT